MALPKKGNCALETPSPGKGELEMAGRRFEECSLCRLYDFSLPSEILRVHSTGARGRILALAHSREALRTPRALNLA